MPRSSTIPGRFASTLASALALAQACPALAGSLEDALRLIPSDATSAIVVANPKSASDDLQQAMDRMGKAEAALGGRPIDLLKAQAGIGPGFDDRGALAAWSVVRGADFALVTACPVTDADAFVDAVFEPVPGGAAGVMRPRKGGADVWVRKTPTYVVAATMPGITESWEPKDGFGAVLADHLGRRGMEIVRTADCFAWASAPVMRSMAKLARETAALDAATARMLPKGDAPEAAVAADLAMIGKSRERGAQVLEQVNDALVAIDFDALAVGVRTFARFDPSGDVAKAMSPAAAAPRDLTALLSRLPDAAFYGASGFDLAAMGGLAHLRQFLATVPGSERIPLPEWLDRVQDKVQQVQVAAYPSKLGIAVGGILNDASLVIVTTDPAAVKAGLRSWIESQTGEKDGLRSEPSWEEARPLKDGSTVSAFAVKEVPTGPGGDFMQRLLKQLVVSSRGLHGFAREVPGALVVTYSQRTDVLDRATAAANGTAKKTLGGNAMVRAMAPWLVPDADVVVFVGVGQLLGAARQIAESLPGGSVDMVPAAPEGLEPVAAAVRSKDATWESALVLPSGVLGVAFDAAKARAKQ